MAECLRYEGKNKSKWKGEVRGTEGMWLEILTEKSLRRIGNVRIMDLVNETENTKPGKSRSEKRTKN